MFSYLRSVLTTGPVYIRIKKDWLSVKDVSSGKMYENTPDVAIQNVKGVKAIAAIGKDAWIEKQKHEDEIEVVNGFNHPRVIIDDFTVAEKTIVYFLSQISDNKIIRPNPGVILHVTEELEGGLTQIEIRALQELAAGAGASKVSVWDGRELSDKEIAEGKYPGDYWLAGAP